ncbi:transposase [Paenibacillus sp. GCM10012303]|uniref:transposase n=1 Tax=Paenibacillus sp. GCM10012303 TaxID=3317340 RepID=UPI00361237FD
MTHQEEIFMIQRAMRETHNTRLYERYLSVRLHLKGRTFTAIADIRTYQTVSTYWQDYQESGIAGLELDHAPGGPKKLSEEQEQTLADTIAKQYPDGNIVMVLDNYRIHHAEKLQSFLKKNPRLQLVFLPKYSPELNPVEGLRKRLKSDVVNNVFFSKFYQIRTHVAAFMKRINQHPLEVIDRLLTWI